MKTHLAKPHPATKLLEAVSFVAMALTLSSCSVDPKPYNSHEKIGPQVNYTITGIDAGDGGMTNAQRAMKAYGLSSKGGKWQLQASSSAAMLAALKKAIQYHAPIVVTGWTPHWMFKKYPIKFLKDPKHIYGRNEHIVTLTHRGFEQKDPGAYKLLKNFHWNDAQIESVMYAVDHGAKPAVAAQKFLNKHPKLEAQWLNDVPKGHGQTVTLDLVAWDSELSSTNIVGQLLKKKGYHPVIMAMEEQPMWAALSSGAADASTAGWIPNTMGHLYSQYHHNVSIVRINLKSAHVCLAVPKYVKNVNTISDLRNK